MTTTATRTRDPLTASTARERRARVAFAAAPVGVFAGWTIMRLGAGRSPGAGWALAHSIWLASYALFGVIVAELHRQIRAQRGRGKTAAILSATIAVAGITAIIGQMIVDLVVGLAASDQADMHELYQRAFGVPGVRPVLYRFGPGLLIVGLAALVIQMAILRRISKTSTALALAGIVMITAESTANGAVRLLLMPAGTCCLWLALNKLRRASISIQAAHPEQGN